MSPSLNSPHDYVNNLKDAILDNAALRDGLTDTEAQPLIDWALRQANYVGGLIENDEDAEFKQTNLNRLILYITRFTTRRLDDKDGEWVDKQISRLNEFSENIGGQALSEDLHQQLLDHDNLSNAEVLTMMTSAFDQAEIPTQPMPTAQPDPPTDTVLALRDLLRKDDDDTRDTQEMAEDVQSNLNQMQSQDEQGKSSFLDNLSSAIDKHVHDMEDDETL